ncbi:DUF6907 domain-containing protein [Streptomyces sp. NY05-11A]|uniref:DUF6907 domain-containing protein n=1 Tax=Streptomyces soliscabiei TaxID=588897 RepID=UPI0029B118C3|nr:hypothetical protein [Streptomyces sp. NY05-11A]MDX2675815.1 hypothetical protein [Streptomyces sp. NY05-11A]
MSERTITLPTTDAGDVTVPEPAWCVGHDGYRPGYQVDILHRGEYHGVRFRGLEIGDASFVLSPCPPGGEVGVSVSLVSQTLDAVGLYELAAVLERHAEQLRGLADQLDVLRESTGGENR